MKTSRFTEDQMVEILRVADKVLLPEVANPVKAATGDMQSSIQDRFTQHSNIVIAKRNSIYWKYHLK